MSDGYRMEIAKETCLGVVTGWISSHFMVLAGKSALYLIGGTLILLRIESQERFVRRFWHKFFRQANVLGERLEDRRFLNRVKRFVRENSYFATGICIGFLIGMSK